MAVTPKQVLNDPRFQALSPEAKRQVLARIDPNFARLTQTQQMLVVTQAHNANLDAQEQQDKEQATRIGGFFRGGGRAIANTIEGLLTPGNPLEGGPALQMLRDARRQMVKALDEGSRRVESGESTAGGLLGIGENLPMVGGMVRKAEEAGPGYFKFAPETVEAATEGATYAALPEIVKRGMEIPGKVLESRAATPGSRIGAITRAKSALNTLESRYNARPIDASRVLPIIAEANYLSTRGFELPKPYTDLAKALEGPRKGGEIIDEPGQPLQLSFKDARTFIKAFNDVIDWDKFGGRGGMVGRLGAQLVNALTDSAKDVMTTPDQALYDQAMRDYTIGKGMQEMFGPVGKIGGKIATYASGVPHPWAFSYLGGKAGEGLAGSLARSVTEYSPKGPRPAGAGIPNEDPLGVLK